MLVAGLPESARPEFPHWLEDRFAKRAEAHAEKYPPSEYISEEAYIAMLEREGQLWTSTDATSVPEFPISTFRD
jgi:hypothetical protein